MGLHGLSDFNKKFDRINIILPYFSLDICIKRFFNTIKWNKTSIKLVNERVKIILVV